MKDSRALSSVQALDDYFDALLVDDDLPQRVDTDVTSDAKGVTELKLQPAKIEAIPLFGGATLTKEERDLSSVERLLSQLQLEDGLEVEVEEVVDLETETEVEADLAVETDTVLETDIAEQTHVAEDVVVDMQAYTETTVTHEPVVDTHAVEPQVDIAAVDDIALDDLVVEDVAVEEAVVEKVVIEDVDVEPAIIEQVQTPASEEIDVDEVAYAETNTDAEPELQAEESTAPPWQNIASEHSFQVLFFESFGVTYAVPLAELGGIHRLEDCNHLIGRPDWYLGLQTERDQQLDVVDTAMWVMPEKITDNSHREGYSYIVLLGDSKWGLACNALLGTESLKGEQVRWREQAGKRPWLAGLVKQKMCALIHVEALIAMLNQGIDANALA